MVKEKLLFHPDKCCKLRVGSHPEVCYGMLDYVGKCHILEVLTSEKDHRVPVDKDLLF